MDRHAENCDICMDEAIAAYGMYKDGKDIVYIRNRIDRRFARL